MLLKKSYQFFRRIDCLSACLGSVYHYQNTLPPSVPPAVPLSHPPAFPRIPQAGSASPMQPKFRLSAAQHRLYVYLLVHDSACILFIKGKCMSSMVQKQVIGWKERHANVCAQE